MLYRWTFADALGLRARLSTGSRLVVIGGGFIGLEIAASARAHDCAVTLVETAPPILMRGVPRRSRRGSPTAIGIARIARQDGEERVLVADGTSLACDVVLTGIGTGGRERHPRGRPVAHRRPRRK